MFIFHCMYSSFSHLHFTFFFCSSSGSHNSRWSWNLLGCGKYHQHHLCGQTYPSATLSCPMGTSREGKVTPSEHHFVQLKETRESSYQVYFILLCWHKKEVIELFYPVLMTTTTRAKNVLFLGGKDRPLVAAPKSRFPVTYVMYRKKRTIISYFIPLLLYFRNNYCMSVCHVFFLILCSP